MKTNKKTYLTPETVTLFLELREGVMLGPSAGLEGASPNVEDWQQYIQYP